MVVVAIENLRCSGSKDICPFLQSFPRLAVYPPGACRFGVASDGVHREVVLGQHLLDPLSRKSRFVGIRRLRQTQQLAYPLDNPVLIHHFSRIRFA